MHLQDNEIVDSLDWDPKLLKFSKIKLNKNKPGSARNMKKVITKARKIIIKSAIIISNDLPMTRSLKMMTKSSKRLRNYYR